jgi:hypothetical protein
MTIERLCKAALAKMGPNKKARLAAHHKRSIEFNKRAAEDFESQKLTDELLARRCTL